MKTLASIVFGSSASTKRYVWYVVAVSAIGALFVCIDDFSLSGWLFSFIGGPIVLAFIFMCIFSQDMKGKTIIRSYLYSRKLRKRIDPVALAIGATIKTDLSPDNGNCYIYYRFVDGNFVTLTVGNKLFNVFTPNWQPGMEKNTEGFDLLLKVITDCKNQK